MRRRPSVASAPTPTARPTEVFTTDEQVLIDGIQRDVHDCRPVRGDDLPPKAIAGVDCRSDEGNVARFGVYRFANAEQMLDAYLARMRAEGVEPNHGSCGDGEGEGPYIPGPDDTDSRQGCFINDQGYANYRVTLPGAHVYIGLLGRDADTAALEDYAWRGNVDTPGTPTLWMEP